MLWDYTERFVLAKTFQHLLIMGCAAGSSNDSDDNASENAQAQQVDYSTIEPYAEGVRVVPISGGDGSTFPKPGDNLTMHYVGKNHGGSNHGKTFDSSRLKKRPFKFTIGQGQVIRGWDEGVMQMSLGQKANLEISWTYGYGEEGARGAIAPRQDLHFEVELLAIN
eukprot:441439_1